MAVERGEYHRVCSHCEGRGHCGPQPYCGVCQGRGKHNIDPRSPTRIAARLERIHRAIGEAGECVERGEMGLHFDRSARDILGRDTHYVPRDMWDAREQALVYRFKPAGFPIALATVFLRLCELVESIGEQLGKCAIQPCDEFESNNPEHIAAALNDLHNTCARVQPRNPCGMDLTEVLYQLVNLAAATDVDLLVMAELKLEYERGMK